jgi:hypothetical protein
MRQHEKEIALLAVIAVGLLLSVGLFWGVALR